MGHHLEHPMIERANRTGYANVVSQPEFNARDYFGHEVLEGEPFIEDGDTVVLMSNLERYLDEVYQFKFKTAL